MENYNWTGKKILIAEDNEINYFLLHEILSDTKASLFWSRNGQETIDIHEKENVDLILMDIKMPVMNGYEATKIIKSRWDVPIIAQTAHAIANDEQKSLEAGCDAYVTKPNEQELLLYTINKFLNKE